jgi:general secretion pathway protein A
MYESYYGLREKPFRLNPDPAFFFGSKGHRRALAYLEYGMHQGEGFIVVTGEIGAGKTTLLRTLLQKVPPGAIVPAQIVSTQVDADDLLRLVASAFGISGINGDKAGLLHRLEQHFTSLHERGKRPLLIVDEAQNLSQRAVEELRMLSNFQVGNASLVQSFLVGQPEFRRIIESTEMRQLRQRVIASYHLGPLSRNEVRQYIEHRLRHVGWDGRPKIEDGAFEAAYRCTGGIPRRINTLFDRALLAGYLNEKLDITSADIDEVNAEMLSEIGTVDPVDTASAPVSSSAPIDGIMRMPAMAGPGVEQSLGRISEQLEAIHVTTRLLYRAYKEHSMGSMPSDRDQTPKS